MSAIYPTWTIKFYSTDTAQWENLTQYVTGQWSADWGIYGNGPIDFMAGTGKLVFRLNNTYGLFTPNGDNVYDISWKKHALVKAEISFGGDTRTWYGQIDSFGFDPDELHNSKFVIVYCVDWMNKAARYPINYPDILLDQTADQVAGTIIAAMPVAPLEQSFAVGETTFPVVFDTVTDFTYAMQEINKVLKSELCYFYVRHGGNARNELGEKLVLENNSTRDNPTVVTIPTYDRLLMETGDFLLLETGDKILLNGWEDFSSNEDAMDYEVSDGDNIVNDITVRYFPREFIPYNGYSPSIEPYHSVWYTGYDYSGNLASNLNVAAGSTIFIGGKYQTSFPGAIFTNLQNNGVGRIVGVSGTLGGNGGTTALGFTFRVNSDGSGGTITSNLEVASLTLRPNDFSGYLTNNGTQSGYVFANLLGYKPYVAYPPTPLFAQNNTSIQTNDHQSLNFDQPYQVTDVIGREFSNLILAEDADPHTNLNRIYYCANRGETEMGVFLSLDIGDIIPAAKASKGIDGNYFIQNMKFTVDPGNIIFYSLGMKELRHAVFMGAAESSSNGGSSLVISDTVYNGSKRLSLVSVALRGSESVSSITRGAQSYTLWGSYELGNTSADPRVELWYLVAPNADIANVTVTLSAASQFQVGVMSFMNVNQNDPLGIFQSSGSTGLVATETAIGGANDLIISVICAYSRFISSDETERWNINSDANWYGAGSTNPGRKGTDMTWTLNAFEKWAMGVVAVKNG